MFNDLTQMIVDWIQLQPVFLIYFYFFLISYLENIVPPIPGDVLIAFAGYLLAEGIISIWPVFTLTLVGSVIGFYHMYHLGQIWGKSIFNDEKSHWILKFIDLSYFEKAKVWMNKYGAAVIVANRFLAGTRSVIALVAGMSKLSKPAVLVSSSVSSILWNSILIGAGWFIHEKWQEIGIYLADYGKFVALVMICVIAWNWWKKKTKQSKTF